MGRKSARPNDDRAREKDRPPQSAHWHLWRSRDGHPGNLAPFQPPRVAAQPGGLPRNLVKPRCRAWVDFMRAE